MWVIRDAVGCEVYQQLEGAMAEAGYSRTKPAVTMILKTYPTVSIL
jgi:hypothetical protein